MTAKPGLVDLRGHTLCRELVRKVLSDTTVPLDRRLATMVDVVDQAASSGDAELGQAKTHLLAAGRDDYERGLDAYVRVMATTANHLRAVYAASRRASLLAAPEDIGPFDRLAYWATWRLFDCKRYTAR